VTAVLWRIEEFDEIDSTNSWLRDRAAQGEPAGLVARADFQHAGRGRLDRRWEAPPRSSLLTSILLRPDLDETSLHLATVAVALSARDALTRLVGLRPDLKWPNDLVVADRKIGGILAEAVRSPDGSLAVVVGLGLNLRYPGPPEAGGTCVRDETGLNIEPRAALDILLDELSRRVELLAATGRPTLRAQYESALTTIGRQVRVERSGDVLEGEATGVDESGRLLLRTASGEQTIAVGDVVHLRTAAS
jgi:BirA family biotin operon repressor/biotin-[acetyl-CoA-carboxylase] ligase